MILQCPARWAAYAAGLCALFTNLAVWGGTLQIGQNFTGSSYNRDSTAQPADANGAVGPAHFVEFINGRFSVYDKATGKRLQTKSDVTFWVNAGVTVSGTVTTTDPRVIFDFYSQRWFASMIDFNLSALHQSRNRFLIAASSDSDPTKPWHGIAFTADPVNGDFADFPTLGLDQRAVYLGGDMFLRTGVRIGPMLVSIPKSSLLSSSISLAGRTSFGIMAYNVRGNILQSAVTTGNASNGEAILSVGSLGLDSQPHSNLILATVDGGDTTTATLSGPTTLNVPDYINPSPATQPDGTQDLDTGDNRISSFVRRVGDVIYAVHSTEVAGRVAVRWYKIDAVGRSVIQTGTIADDNLDLFYPSIAANDAGTVVIACDGSSDQSYISCYAVLGEMANGQLTFGDLVLLKSGTASYQALDATGTSRWGDYSAVSLDPADPTRFWTIQLYAATPSVWSTQITELLTAVRLSIAVSDSSFTLSWPTGGAGYKLQYTPTLTPSTQWQDVEQTPVSQGNSLSVTLPSSVDQGYFRLSQ